MQNVLFFFPHSLPHTRTHSHAHSVALCKYANVLPVNRRGAALLNMLECSSVTVTVANLSTKEDDRGRCLISVAFMEFHKVPQFSAEFKCNNLITKE